MASRFCTRCGAAIPVGANACPSCHAPLDAGPSASGPAPSASPAPLPAGPPRRVCGNCHSQMRWIGHYSLRAGGYTGAVGTVASDVGQLTETLLPFSLYYCQSCGKFDFYYPGT